MIKLKCHVCGNVLGYIPLKKSDGDIHTYRVPIVGVVPMYCQMCAEQMYPDQVKPRWMDA